jgi:HAD superfamily hydrolase (TIGR01549 family)
MNQTFFTQNFKIPQDVKIISFDIFDTLLLRPFEKPTDLFQFMNPSVNEMLGGQIDFKVIRKLGEKNARKNLNKKEEITIDDIYDHITQISEDCKEEIKNLEQQFEMKLCFARESGKVLYDIAKQSGLKIIAISDTYFDVNFINKILTKNNFYFDEIYCSSSYKKTKKHGSLYKEIIFNSGILGKEILHIGDNIHSDIKKAKSSQIKTFHLPLLRKELYKNSLYKNIFRSKKCTLTSIGLGFICSNLDKEKKEIQKNSLFDGGLYRLGFNAFGSVLFAYTAWVFKMAKEHKIKKLFFISRDGYILHKAFQILYNEDYSIQSFYLECSRRSLSCLLINDKKDVVDFFTKRYSRASIRDFIIQKLECDPKKIEHRIKEFGFNSMEEPVKKLFPTKFTKHRLSLVTLFYSDEILQRVNNEKQGAMNYLKKMGALEEGIAICDVGYGGTVQKIISQVGRLERCFGFYLFTNQEAKNNHQIFSLTSKNRSKFQFKIQSSFVRLMESVLLSAPFGTLKHYTQDGTPIHDDLHTSESNRLLVNSCTWKGMLDFIIFIKQSFQQDVKLINYNTNSVFRVFNNFVFAPTKEDAKILQNVVFENKSNVGGYSKILEDNLWKIGSFSIKYPRLYQCIKFFLKIWLKLNYKI